MLFHSPIVRHLIRAAHHPIACTSTSETLGPCRGRGWGEGKRQFFLEFLVGVPSYSPNSDPVLL